jgi:hypothetical protein
VAVIEAEADAIPSDPAQLAERLKDPQWRLSNLYKILIKGEEGQEDTILQFRPNRAQRRFMSRLWYRNVILKARQLGFTTLICILWLDHALFRENQRCGIVAHNRDAAATIFRDKVKFAYENLPAPVKALIPILENNADEIRFANNSAIQVATSLRSGTYHRVLVSEYGKICAQYPQKAVEVQTGTLPAVPLTGIAVIESTAEGQDGDFFKKSQIAQALYDKGAELGLKDWRFHFFPWWQDPNYRIDPSTVIITDEHDDYFEQVEARTGIELDLMQRAWYVATLMGDFSGDEQTMWREYPSYPEEAFKVSTDGVYYAKELAQARKQGRIGLYPYMPGYPVNTFWDIGLNDVTSIWFHQRINGMDRFIRYYENSGEGPAHFVQYMQAQGYVYGTHYLPHDGNARRMTVDQPMTYKDMLGELKIYNVEIVQRVLHITTGIQAMRQVFPGCCFDEKNCAVGLRHVGNYRKEWNNTLGCWRDTPRHDQASNAADALRQFAQGYKGNVGTRKSRKPSDWKTA